jgi:hypothetical protein
MTNLGAKGVVIALALVGCAKPALVLEFVDLPRQAGALSVRLSSTQWLFRGTNVETGPVTVHYFDGGLRISIDRDHLAGKGDHLRLGLITPSEELNLEALAEAQAGSRALAAETRAWARPGEDLTLRLVFTEVPSEEEPDPGRTDGGRPLGPSDGGAAAPDAAAPAPDLAGPPPPDAATPPAVCTPGPVKPISVSVPSAEPSLAFVATPPTFAVVWTDGSRVLFNTVDRDGKLQHPSDIVAVAAEGAAIYRNPRLAPVADALALAYGKSGGGGGGAGVVVRMVQPATGAAGISLLLNGPTTDGSAPEISGLVAGNNLAAVSRASGSQPAQARVDLVSRVLSPLKSQSHAALSGTRAAGIGWAADRYGVAALDGSPRGGTLATFDVDLGFDRPFAFSTDGATPVTAAGATVSVAGAGDRLAVAWIDGRPCPTCKTGREVFLGTVDARSGVMSPSLHVSASDGALPKLFPHLVWDGASYAVIWQEYQSPAVSRVMLRRFDPQLRPLGAIVDLSAGAPARPVGDIDLVVEARNVYGVAMTPHLGAHHFTRVTCSGP